MSDSQLEISRLLNELRNHWNKRFPRRATGGQWALAGFAFQANIYLLRFFQHLQNRVSPTEAPLIEQLSDIVCPRDGKLVLHQVKRTLTKTTLVSAVEEAYAITDLCRHETPALLEHLRFQIVCHKSETPTTIFDLSMSDVVENGDSDSWNAMLGCFDATPAIVEERSYHQLHTFLWNAGIKRPTLLIERCAGRLLMSFGVNQPAALDKLACDLADDFFGADREADWRPIGRILSAADIALDARQTEYKEVLTGQTPQLQHLQKGFFRERWPIFEALYQAFTTWVESLNVSALEVTDKVPVFWISGRSGDGKSVLLLQLIAETLRRELISPLIQLKGGDDLPRLFAAVPDNPSEDPPEWIFAVVDDVYDLHRHDRDTWDASLLEECDNRPLSIALITCGPTEQREQFSSRLSGPFQVTHFDVPTLDLEEFQEFVDWFASRTGRARDYSALTTDNPLLVQLMFELAKGERMPEFARRFKKRLMDMEVFEAARTIVSVNALYMDAPLHLLTNGKAEDALEYLCKEEQLHFRVVTTRSNGTKGVRLAHSHLAWLLLTEWVDAAPTTLAKAWARELDKALCIFEDHWEPVVASNLIAAVLNTTRLSDKPEASSSLTADRYELLREFYRLHVNRHGGRPLARTLPRWLDVIYKIPQLELDPDPALCAVAFLADDEAAPSLHGSVVYWLWMISESRNPSDSQKLRSMVKDFLFRRSNTPGLAGALARLFSRLRNDPELTTIVYEWLNTTSTSPQAYQLIVPLLTAYPFDATVRTYAIDWIRANEKHPNAYWLLAPLVSTSVSDPSVSKAANDWLTANKNHPKAYQVIAPLVSANLSDPAIRKAANDWLTANENHPMAYQIIAPMLRASSGDPAVYKWATDWLLANKQHPHSYWLLGALVSANPGNAVVRTLATDWLADNENHPTAYQLIGSLVRASSNDAAVYKWATDWLSANKQHPHSYWLLGTLVSAHPGKDVVRTLATDWLGDNENHPMAYQLIAPLVRASPGDPVVYKWATDWLLANKQHPHSYLLLAALVTANPDNVVVRTLATDWLADNEKHPTGYQLIGSLVRASPGDAAVYKWATDWLLANKRHPNSYQVLAALVSSNPGNVVVQTLALDWLADHENHPMAHQLIAPLLRASPNDPAVYKLATDWLTGNDNHLRAYQLIAPFLTAHSNNSAVWEFVTQWLTTNETHPKYHEVLRVAIARSGGAKDWLALGVRYATNPNCVDPRSMYGVLITAGKAEPALVDMAFDFLDGKTVSNPDIVVYHLSRALVRNFHNAVRYLNGPFEEKRKLIVCGSIARGMKRLPDTVAAFALNVVDELAPKHLHYILLNVIRKGFELDYLDQMIADWLISNERRPGYGGMLKTLSNNPDYRKRILALNILPARIRKDFAQLICTTST
jgi:predicted Zn-dependent protease